MKEIAGNIRDYHAQGNWIVITTNGMVKKDGSCVMGRGVALQAKNKFPKLPKELGQLIKNDGNHLFMFGPYKILTLPVKNNWYEKADINLIERSIQELSELSLPEFKYMFPDEIYLVRPGCGNGQLKWEDVKPICEKYLNDKFVIVDLPR